MPHDLTRFKKAQEHNYETALTEIRSGQKQSHWMWYIFPQLAGLGFSEISQYYGIKGIEEAREYIADDFLRSHLVEISEGLLALESNNATLVMGYPDDLKLKSSMTLFLLASGHDSKYEKEARVFKAVLDKYFGGEMDGQTVEMVQK
ncbi:MAG: DUF1810 domain-containing protein [Treponema sp.]|nr:DUF1810 domain-containing protein [Treponema sp.]